MGIFTGATEGLNQFLAQREVEQRQALIDEITRAERARQSAIEQREIGLREKTQAESMARQKTQDEEVARQRRGQRASNLQQNLMPGESDEDTFKLLDEFGMAPGVLERKPGVVLPLVRPPAPPTAEGAIPTLPTAPTQVPVVPPAVLSLGGAKFQEARTRAEEQGAAATAAREEAAARAEADRAFRASESELNRASREETAALARQATAAAAATRQGAGPTLPQVRSLRNDWTRLTAPVRTIDRQWSEMQTGLERYAKDPIGGSQAVLVTFQKILDPDSVVRESEYARTEQQQSLLNRMFGKVNQKIAGGSTLSKSELTELVETARGLRSGISASFAGDRKVLERIADQYGVDRDLIFSDNAPEGGGPVPAAAAPTGKSKYEIVSVK